MKPRYQIIPGDALTVLRTMEDQSVHCVVTSPPYWGLRDYDIDGQLGLEPTPDQYVAKMVEVFHEVFRVLRNDGTLWLNIGDSYQNSKGQAGGVDPKQPARRHGLRPHDTALSGVKRKNLVGIPWRLALALQADGWYLRDCIIWHKPNTIPGSQKDRTVTVHEYIFLLSKRPHYYFDNVAISELASTKQLSIGTTPTKGTGSESAGEKLNNYMKANGGRYYPERRNPRSVWKIACKSYKGAHFAAFPPALPIRRIKAGTSEHGVCSTCGKPWRRVIKKTRVPTRPGTNSKCCKHETGDFQTPETLGWNRANRIGNRDPQRHITRVETTGWQPTCNCQAGISNPVVLDPFNGVATTGLASLKLGCDFIGIELNPEYIELSHKRLRPSCETLF